MQWCFGPWEWRADEHGAQAWHGPESMRVAFDLRVPSEVGNAGVGLFLVEDVPAGFDALGEDWSTKLRPADRARINPRCKAVDLLGCILELVTDLSDVDGQSGLKPLMNHQRGRCQIAFGTRRQQFRSVSGRKHFDRQREQTLKDLDEIRSLEDAGVVPAGKHEQVLGFELESRGIKLDDWKAFVGKTRSRKWRGPRKPETIISDDFNRANEDPLTGWSLLGGVDPYYITSNEIYSGGANEWKSCVYNTPLSGSDNESQLDSVNVSPQGLAGGPLCRGSNSAATGYLTYVVNVSSHIIYRFVAASPTNIASGGTGGYGHTFKCVASGSTISAYYDGGLTLSTTDTTISSGLYCGHGGFSSNRRWDNFIAQDLAATGSLIYTTYHSTERGVERAVAIRNQG